jgi:preprotein translocase subunit SecA
LGEPEFPDWHAGGEIVKAAESGKEEPVKGSIFDGLSPAQFAVCNFISDSVRKAYEIKISFENPEALKEVERYTILSAIDKLWQEHLYEMDSLRYSIGLRAHGQRDPLIEYKAEAFKIFEELMVNIKTEICHNIFRSASSLMAFENFLRNVPQQTTHQATSAFGGTSTGTARPRPKRGPSQGSDIVSEAAAAVEKAKPVRWAPRSAATTPAPAAAGRSTSSAAGRVDGDRLCRNLRFPPALSSQCPLPLLQWQYLRRCRTTAYRPAFCRLAHRPPA